MVLFVTTATNEDTLTHICTESIITLVHTKLSCSGRPWHFDVWWTSTPTLQTSQMVLHVDGYFGTLGYLTLKYLTFRYLTFRYITLNCVLNFLTYISLIAALSFFNFIEIVNWFEKCTCDCWVSLKFVSFFHSEDVM